MSKKRLEEIKEKVVVEKVYVKQLNTRNNGYWTKSYLVLKDDWNWLIEQAERVQELESELQELRKRYLTLTKENNQVNDELIDEFRKNKRLRKALEFYAEGKHATGYGAVARKALEGESE